MADKEETIFKAAIYSLWPAALAFTVFALLFSAINTGFAIIDVDKWPSAYAAACKQGDVDCFAIDRFSLTVRVIIMTSALFPLLNTYGYLSEVRRASIKRSRVRGTDHDFAGSWATGLCWIAIILNAVWVVLIYLLRYNPLYDQLAILVLFLIFAIIDVILMWIHSPDRFTEGRFEYDFFFGNAFFIDVPILIGVAGLIVATQIVMFGTVGRSSEAIIRAAASGAAVTNVALSQIIFSFLQLQLRLKRRRRF